MKHAPRHPPRSRASGHPFHPRPRCNPQEAQPQPHPPPALRPLVLVHASPASHAVRWRHENTRKPSVDKSNKHATLTQTFPPAIRNPQSAIRNPQSAIRNPQSAIRNPQSAIRNPQSAIRNPPIVILRPNSQPKIKHAEPPCLPKPCDAHHPSREITIHPQ
jgi:hypothetical protein